MPEQHIIPEYRDQRKNIRYPFIDAATLISSNTDQVLDNDIFIDASLHPVGVSNSVLYISSITLSSRNALFDISDSTNRVVASANIDLINPTTVVPVIDTLDRQAGILIPNTEAVIRLTTWAAVTHNFTAAATQFVPTCVIPVPQLGLQGILTSKNELLTGDVLIVGENGVVVRKGATDTDVRIDIVGDPLFRRKLCGTLDTFKTPRFVQTINGCPPDKYGNFNITVGDHINDTTILRIYKTTAGLTVKAVGNSVIGNT